MQTRDFHFINVSLPLIDETKKFELKAAGGVWTSIQAQEKDLSWEDAVPITFGDGLLQMNQNPIDLQGRLLLPGFVDMHMHLDKAYSIKRVGNETGTLLEAITNYRREVSSFTKEEIKQRILQTALRAVSYGTTHIRTHLDFHFHSGRDIAYRTMEAALEAREELRGVLNLQLFPMCPYDHLSSGAIEAAEELLKLGMDGLGGAPHLSKDPEGEINSIFKLAVKYGKPIDLHADESDDPARRTVISIAQRTLQYGYQGKVTAGHLSSLSAMSRGEAESIMALMAEAKLGAVALPAANLYLLGIADTGPIRRGVTRVKELISYGVPTAAASDNIQDPFHPFGRGDLLQIGLLTAYAAHMGSPAELRSLLRMITEVPAALMGISDYGVKQGSPASFVVTDASSVEELFTEQSPARWVFVKGKMLHAWGQQQWAAPEWLKLQKKIER